MQGESGRTETSASTDVVPWSTYATSISASTVISWLQYIESLPPLGWYIPDKLEVVPNSLYIHGRFGGKLKQPYVGKIQPTGKGIRNRKVFNMSPRGFEHERFR